MPWIFFAAVARLGNGADHCLLEMAEELKVETYN
jgi:hypothetical protein